MRKYISIILVIWLTAGFISLFWNLYDERKERETLAFQNARTFFTQLVQTRSWNAQHGGVYVPISPDVQPNPFLNDINRDLTTANGLQLTKINPAFMTRQLAEIAAKQSGARFHITSLTPIRPENRAADWEQKWLEDFQAGVKERGSFSTTPEGMQFRYMAPLFVKEACLQCHGKQGYKSGDIRGGISLILPIDVPLFNWGMVISHMLAMAVGSAFILLFGRRLIESSNKLITANAHLENEVHERKRAQNKLLQAHDTLEDRVKERTAELHEEVQQRILVEKALELNEKRFRLALDAASDGVWDRNLRTGNLYFGDNLAKMFGYTAEEVPSLKAKWKHLLHPDDKSCLLTAVKNHLKGNTSRCISEYRVRNKSGGWQWVLSRGKVVEWDVNGKPLRFIGTHTDITHLKNIEEHLQNSQIELEQKIKERTKELEETNIALKVLLAKREESKTNLEKQILSNVTDLIDPYLNKLKKISSHNEQQVLLGILESNLSEITSHFSSDLALNFDKLTPTEIQVANLIKQGKRTKDIAELMSLSPGTISIHRKNIRKKLGLANQNVNLHSFLSSYSH